MFDSLDVLGTTYTIEFKQRDDDVALTDADGYCDELEKRIVICLCENEANKLGVNWELHKKRCLKHEVIHAFLFESGFSTNWEHKDYGHEELMIDWIVTQFPKIYPIFTKIDMI